nr:unnamed protein product [Callosobruchus analis]
MGDFNAPNFIHDGTSDRKVLALQSLLNVLDLQQYNGILNDTGRILDLVLSNLKCNVLRDLFPLVPEDAPYHPALGITVDKISVKACPFSTVCDTSMYNFRKAKYPQLYEALFIADWSFLDDITDANQAVDALYKFIYNILDTHVPKYRAFSHKYPPWFTPDIIRNVKCKAKLLNRFKRSGDYQILNEFKSLRATIKSQLSKAYSDYLSRVQSSICNDPRQFWSYVHSKNKSSRIPNEMKLSDSTLKTPSAIINGFADFFNSVFATNIDCTDYTRNTKSRSQLNIYFDNITEKEIISASKKLKNKLTSGPDNIPSLLVKDCIYVFAKPLLSIFNLSVTTNTFPDTWKLSRVCPVFKSGNRSIIENYRPISILCNFAKVFEVILYNRIYSVIHRSLSPFQHGFLAGRSTVTNLTVFTQAAVACVDKKGQLDAVFTDFTKAFDKLDHNILLGKLSQFGLHSSALLLVKSYLHQRQQYVMYNGHKSIKYIAKSGVPQGSNLGPLLFVLFIDDISESLTCSKLLFADDLKIFCSITDVGDCEMLQRDIHEIDRWCRINKIHLNPTKCKVCSFTRKKSVIGYDYATAGTTISRCETVKDLGVIFDTKLTYSQHIHEITCKASRAYGFVVRNCRNFKSPEALIALYSTYIRSHLEYASVIWNPFYNHDKSTLEGLQRKFLKFLAYRIDGIYPAQGFPQTSLLCRFNIQSLEIRRVCAALTFLYKLLHNQVDSCDILSQLNFSVPGANTRSFNTFYCDRARTNLYIKSPIYFMCNSFNCISSKCDINADKLGNILNIALNHFTNT